LRVESSKLKVERKDEEFNAECTESAENKRKEEKRRKLKAET